MIKDHGDAAGAYRDDVIDRERFGMVYLVPTATRPIQPTKAAFLRNP